MLILKNRGGFFHKTDEIKGILREREREACVLEIKKIKKLYFIITCPPKSRASKQPLPSSISSNTNITQDAHKIHKMPMRKPIKKETIMLNAD